MASFSYKKQAQRYFSWRLRMLIQRHWRKSPLVLVLILGLVYINTFTQEATSKSAPPAIIINNNYQCRVTHLDDGDSFSAQCHDPRKNNSKTLPIKIRIWGIDAPEMGQKPWGKNAKIALSKLINNAPITVKVMAQDRYKRTVAKIYQNQQDLGLELVKQGHAVVYDRYNNDPNYKKHEKKARIAGLGIWSKKGSQQNPEKWRRLNPR